MAGSTSDSGSSAAKFEDQTQDALDDAQYQVLTHVFRLLLRDNQHVPLIRSSSYSTTTNEEKTKLRQLAHTIFDGIHIVTAGVISINTDSLGRRRHDLIMDLLCHAVRSASSPVWISPIPAVWIQPLVYHDHAWKHSSSQVIDGSYYEASIRVSLTTPKGSCKNEDIVIRLFPKFTRTEMNPPETTSSITHPTVTNCNKSCENASSQGLSVPNRSQKAKNDLPVDESHDKTRAVLAHLVTKFSSCSSKDPMLIRDAIFSERRFYIHIPSSKQIPEPIYYGTRLYNVHRRVEYLGKALSEFGTTWISPSLLLWSDYPQLTAIRLLSFDGRWATPVLNELIRGRIAGENPETYFERGSIMAKEFIEKFLDGEEPPSDLKLSEDQLGGFQACPQCLEVVRSRSLRDIGDVKMCLLCCTGSRKVQDQTHTSRSSLNTMEKDLFFKVYANLKGDENKGLAACRSTEDRLQVANTLWMELEKDLKVPSHSDDEQPRYEDTYVKQVVQRYSRRGQTFGIGKFTKRLSPFQLSVDGIHPWALSSDGSKGYHIQGNLAVTTVSLNTLKYIYPSVVLCALAAFRAAATREDIHNAFVGIVNASIVSACFGFRETNRALLAQEMDDDLIVRMHEAFSTGRLPDDISHLLQTPRKHPFKLWNSDRCPKDNKFKPLQGVKIYCAAANCRDGWPCEVCRRTAYRHPRRKYRESQFLQIAELYGYSANDDHLWTIDDGYGHKVFYPFASDSKQLAFGVWTEFTCDIWFQMRHMRIEVWCDVRNDHEEGMDEELLMFVALHSRLSRMKRGTDGTARDVAGLEPIPLINTPITASFARKRHGPTDGFISGYTRKPPVNQSEDFQHELNNCELDCKVTNWACADWLPDHWEKIFGQLDNLREDCAYLRPHPDMFKNFYVLPADDIRPKAHGGAEGDELDN